VKRVVILDDYQSVALSFADWGVLDGVATVENIDYYIGSESELVDTLSSAEIVVAMRERTAFPRSVLERLSQLELLVTTGPQNGVIDVEAATELGITVCGTRGYLPSNTEHAWALILACSKRICQCDRTIRAGGWQSTISTDMRGARFGVIGLGRYGTSVSKIAQAFEMEVVAWSENLTPERCAEVGGVTLVTKEELLATSDVVSIHLVLSQRTRGLIGERELRLMKKTAFLVNSSRGPIIEEAALIKALDERWISGAGLDVFDVEPLPSTHPLRRLDNVVLTPHIGYVTPHGYRPFFVDAVDDIVQYLNGNVVRQIVQRDTAAPHSWSSNAPLPD
jgi:phosphoglycerate dehydrogenase-like enzyme